MNQDKDFLRTIQLYLAYNEDTGIFNWKQHKKFSAGSVNAGGYLQIRFQGKIYYAHRLAWLYVNKEWPKFTINHKNGDKLDNSIENLEDVEQHVNLSLRHKVKGVRERNGKFYARVCKNKKETQVGPFTTSKEAHNSYLEIRKEIAYG